MNIRWNNVAVFLFTSVGLVLAIRHRYALEHALNSILRLGPGHPPEDHAAGVIALGLVGVCVVAVVRLLTQWRDQRSDD